MPKRVNPNRNSQIFADDLEIKPILDTTLPANNTTTTTVSRNQHKQPNADTQSVLGVIDSIWAQTPLLVVERILFELYLIKLKEQTDTDLSFYGGGDEEVLLTDESCSRRLFPGKRLTFENYEFLAKVDRNFVNITKYASELKSSYYYANNRLNVDRDSMRNIMVEFVRPKDLEFSIIAGGFLSEYKSEDAISARFPELYQRISANADVDIYVMEKGAGSKADKICATYLSLMNKRKLKVFDYCNGDEEGYAFECFKVRTADSRIINFVFVNKESLYGCVRSCNIDLVNAFDVDPAKVFYSYKYDSVYAHVTLFKPYRSWHKPLESEYHEFGLYKYIDMLETEKVAIEASLAVGVKHRVTESLIVALTVGFIRLVKYCFKGYANTREESDTCMSLIEFFYAKYGDAIDFKIKSMHSFASLKRPRNTEDFIKKILLR